MFGRAGFTARLLIAAVVLVGCAAPGSCGCWWSRRGAASLGGGQTAAQADPAPDRFEEPLAAAGPDVVALDLRLSTPPAVRTWLDAPATFRGLPDRGDAGFLDGGSPAQWFDLVVFHRNATPTEGP
jgi:hypothetical protein